MRMIARVVVVLAAIFGISGSGSSRPVPQDRIPGAVDANQVVRLRGTRHPRALVQLDDGRTDSTRMVSGAITFRLSPTQQADMDQLLRTQQDPKSANYHRWLTPDQYAARFGMPIFSAAALDRSMIRPSTKGPRSVMRTITELFVSALTTRTIEPKGNVRWAAVIACMS